MLSENKILISVSFVALILTLKADPQMVKLIQNIAGADDGEQHKDNNNNMTNYLEVNKDNSVTYTAEEKRYSDYLPTIQMMIDSLKINALLQLTS
ncbi:MAG TPA: hypothetical protein VKA87_03665 [Nitrososphaeraceae archaeon]|nr:hypothetical protein [Nitrososphaeraceae archaeon]